MQRDNETGRFGSVWSERTVRVTVCLPLSCKDRVKELARSEGVDMSTMIRELIAARLQQEAIRCN